MRQIETYLREQFEGRVDMTDYDRRSEEETRTAFLSRALGAYALTMLSGLDQSVAVQYVTDGFDDNGIDAVYFDRGEAVLYVVQSKWIQDGQGAPGVTAVAKLRDGFNDLIRARFGRFNEKLQRHKPELLAALENTKTELCLALVHTGNQKLGAHGVRLLDDLRAELNDVSDVFRYVCLGQGEVYKAISGQAEGDPICEDVVIRQWGQVLEPHYAVYGQVDGEVLVRWWEEHGNRLLARNLRKFIGDTEVNKAIQQTLSTQPDLFWYFNNGITVLCSKLVKKPIQGPDRDYGFFRCDGISIVNGAQTVGSLAKAAKQKPEAVATARVPIRFISLDKCGERFAHEVTRATNTQNRIEGRDFASLDPEQERLSRELWFLNKRYAFKSGDPEPEPIEGCTLVEATVALACRNRDLSLAVQAKREIGRLWDDINKAPYKKIFNGSVTGVVVWRSVLVLRLVDEVLRGHGKVLDGMDRLITVHGNRFILHRVFRRLPGEVFDDPDYDFSLVEEEVRNLAHDELEVVTAAVHKIFSDSYMASVFKNIGRCRALERELDGSS